MNAFPIGALLLTAAFTIAWTQPLPADDEASPATKGETATATADGEPDLGPVRPAGSLLECSIAGLGRMKIVDLGVDLARGRVRVVILHDQTNKNPAWLLPIGALKIDGDEVRLADGTAEYVKTAPKLGAGSFKKGLTPAFVDKLHRHFQLEPVADATEKDEATPRPIAFLSDIRKMPVKNAKGDELGTVEDLVIAEKDGVIAYAALASSLPETSEKLFPVPLAAFVVEPGKKHWVLELPEATLEESPTFAAGEWPATVDRGWIEYVHVRYGVSPFSGVREELRAESRKID